MSTVLDVSKSLGRQRDGLLRVNRSTDVPRPLWYHPDWRFRQSRIYINAANRVGEGYTIPRWEDDEMVRNVYMFQVSNGFSSPRWGELIRLAMECVEWNQIHGLSAKIKAYTIADLSCTQIGEKLGIDEEVVEVFQQIFFDVKEIMYNRQRLASVIFPFAPEQATKLSPVEKREFLWIAASFIGGEQLADHFTTNYVSKDLREMGDMVQMVISTLTAQSSEYGIALRCEGLPKAVHFDKFVAIQDIHQRMLSTQAVIEQLQQNRAGADKVGNLKTFLEGVGVQVEHDIPEPSLEESLVTHLSISDLRAKEKLEGSTAEKRKAGIETRLLTGSANVGITVQGG